VSKSRKPIWTSQNGSTRSDLGRGRRFCLLRLAGKLLPHESGAIQGIGGQLTRSGCYILVRAIQEGTCSGNQYNLGNTRTCNALLDQHLPLAIAEVWRQGGHRRHSKGTPGGLPAGWPQDIEVTPEIKQ